MPVSLRTIAAARKANAEMVGRTVSRDLALPPLRVRPTFDIATVAARLLALTHTVVHRLRGYPVTPADPLASFLVGVVCRWIEVGLWDTASWEEEHVEIAIRQHEYLMALLAV
jgi:hypothetical protein